MHEYSIAQALVDQVVTIAKDNRATRVTRALVQVGKLRGIVPEVLRWGFEISAADTIAQGAELVIDEVPILIQCRDCGAENRIDWPVYICPACGSPAVNQVTGNELVLMSMEIANDTDTSPAEHSQGQ
jgi:hydrogenase nickel incorporation protein HypA/HybF